MGPWWSFSSPQKSGLWHPFQMAEIHGSYKRDDPNHLFYPGSPSCLACLACWISGFQKSGHDENSQGRPRANRFKWSKMTCLNGRKYPWKSLVGSTLQDLRGAWGGFRGLKWWVFHCVVFKWDVHGKAWQWQHVPQSLMYCLVFGWSCQACHNNIFSQKGASFLDGFKSSLEVKDINKKISRAPRYRYRVLKPPKKIVDLLKSPWFSRVFCWNPSSRSFGELPCARMWGSCNATWITWSRWLGWSFLLMATRNPAMITSWWTGSLSHYLQGYVIFRWCRISEPWTVLGYWRDHNWAVLIVSMLDDHVSYLNDEIKWTTRWGWVKHQPDKKNGCQTAPFWV